MTRFELVFSIMLIGVIIWLWNTTAKYDGLNVHSYFPFVSPIMKFFLSP
jgi:hypothetical protein